MNVEMAGRGCNWRTGHGERERESKRESLRGEVSI